MNRRGFLGGALAAVGAGWAFKWDLRHANGEPVKASPEDVKRLESVPWLLDGYEDGAWLNTRTLEVVWRAMGRTVRTLNPSLAGDIRPGDRWILIGRVYE